MQLRMHALTHSVGALSLFVVPVCALQEILADAVERLSPPEKRGSIVRNSANVVAFEEHTDPATGQTGRQGGREGA